MDEWTDRVQAAADRWEANAGDLTLQQWEHAMMTPRGPGRPPAQHSRLLGIATGLACAGILIWPLGLVTLLVLRRWRRYSPRPESWASALAGTLTVFASIQAGIALYIAGLLIAAHI